MTYTKDIPNQKYFLNDKNIAQELVYGDIQLNAIPSLDLVSSLYNALSAKDAAISDQVDANRANDKAELSNILSSYADSLCAAVSSQVDNNRVADKAELSNVLSSYANELCSNISSQVDTNRADDKAELSNTLSTYVDTSVLNLSTSLSDQVNAEFVHKDGDTISFLNVKEQLSVVDAAKFDSNVRIVGTLIQGKSVKANENGGIALGISAEAVHSNSFVWNGNDNVANYQSHGEHGTFNINPEQGVNGFYVGDKTLSDIVHDDVQLTADNLTAQISIASALVSAWVDADREADKAELSNTLSSYANQLCADLSGQVDNNRVADKAELSNTLSTYVDNLSTSLSNTVKNAGFANAAATTFTYDEHNHKISLVMTDYIGTTTTLTVDTTDFIKNRIVDHVDVVNPTQDPSLSESVLRIWWTPDTSSTSGIYTDVPISQLAKIYKEGYGIDITDDLTISVTNDIANSADLNAVAATLNDVSSNAVPTLRADVDEIQDYVDLLSSDSVSKPGILLTLSNSIKADVQNLDTLSSDMKALSAALTADIDTNKQDIASIQAFDDMLSAVASGVPVGVIPTMSHDISVLEQRFNVATIYAGKISINKYHPDWIDAGYGNNLSSIISFFNLAEDNKVKNGSMFEIEFTQDTYTFDNPVFAADQTYMTDDGFQLAHKDWLYIVTDPGEEYVTLEDIAASNVRFMPAVKFYEKNELSNTVNQNYIWLSGNNNPDATYQVSVECVGRTPQIVTVTGHSIGGNNYFADGGNIFAGVNSIEKLSTVSISADSLSAYDSKFDNVSAYMLSANEMSAYNAKISILSGYDVNVDNISAVQLSAGSISADWQNVKNSSNGYSLYDLSTALSNKIYIDDRIESNAGTSDLSIVKLSKSDYEALVASNTSGVDLLSSTLYIVDSNIIDCYGEKIINLAAPTDDADASTKKYVDDNILSLSTSLSTDIDNLSTSLSTDIDALSTNLSTDIMSLSTALSTALSNKIYIDDRIESNAGTSDLSIVKLSKADYEALVVNGTQGVDLLSSTLYIVDADVIDCYGEKIINLAAPTTDTDASTKKYVDDKTDAIATVFSDLYTQISSINQNSTLTDIITAVVSIKNAIAAFTS